MSRLVAVILAAGKGTRMKSSLPKVLHKVGGVPMLGHVLTAAEEAGAERKIVVAGFGAELVQQYVGMRGELVLQQEQLGTGHAVLQAKQLLRGYTGTLLILCGDTPLLLGEELAVFCRRHQESGAAATVLTTVLADASGYGRIIRSEDASLAGIVEEKDATAEEKQICEVNTGIYCLEAPLVFELLSDLDCANAQGEYYLTDIVAMLVAKGQKTEAVCTEEKDMVLGVNSRVQLAAAESILRKKLLTYWMEEGVTIMDPAATYIEKTVTIGRDTVLYPGTWLEGCTHIGADCRIGPQVRLKDVKVGNGSELHFTYAHECEVGQEVTVGPFAHLRPSTVLGDHVKVGNFVEVKNSRVDMGSKLPHLSYIGDADVGKHVNIGCGSITVNYDGKKKYRTTIEDEAFVGCNSNLVAPVTVGRGAFVAAGSTVTKDVPPDDLAVARAKQVNIKGWAAKQRKG